VGTESHGSYKIKKIAGLPKRQTGNPALFFGEPGKPEKQVKEVVKKAGHSADDLRNMAMQDKQK